MNIKGGKIEGEGVGKTYSVKEKTLSRKYIKNIVDVDYYSVGGSNHLKNSLSTYFLQNSHYSLPYHILEIRITALVQILYQQLGARRRAFAVFVERFFLPSLSLVAVFDRRSNGAHLEK